MNTNELLDAVKSKLNLPSDYALARKVLRVDLTSLKDMRRRGLSDERALQVATLLELNPAWVLMQVHADRAKDPEIKRVWKVIADSIPSKLSALFAAALAALFLVGSPTPAKAATDTAQFSHAIHYALLRLRRFVRSWRLSVALAGLFMATPAQAETPEWLWFLAGAALPVVAHEAGHEIAGGDAVDWNGTDWQCNRPCNGSRIAAAGFVAEVLATELAGRSASNTAFKRGVRLSAGLHLLAYALRGKKDFDNFGDSDRDLARAAIAGIGVYNLIQFRLTF